MSICVKSVSKYNCVYVTKNNTKNRWEIQGVFVLIGDNKRNKSPVKFWLFSADYNINAFQQLKQLLQKL